MFFGQQKISIRNRLPKISSDEYIALRESLWKEELIRKADRGEPLWNGVLYYVDSIRQTKELLDLAISTCEYKDLVFKETTGNTRVTENILDHKSYLNVQCLISDKCGNLLFGKNLDGHLVPVGGTVRKEDFEILSYSDLEHYARKEIEIETLIDPRAIKLTLIGCVDNAGIFSILFKARVGEIFKKDVQYLKRGEFKDEMIITPDQIRERRFSFSARFESVRLECIKFVS